MLAGTLGAYTNLFSIGSTDTPSGRAKAVDTSPSTAALKDVGLEKPGRPLLAGTGAPYTKLLSIASTALVSGGAEVAGTNAVGTTLPSISAVKDVGFEKPGRPLLAGTGVEYTNLLSIAATAVAFIEIMTGALVDTGLPTLKARTVPATTHNIPHARGCAPGSGS